MNSLSINWGGFESNLEGLMAISRFLGPDDFPMFSQVAEGTAIRAEILYREYLGGKPTPEGRSVKNPTGAVARGVNREEVGLMKWRIFNDSPVADALEDGTKERDMKDCLATAKRARRAKDGSLYLIIPFRHGSPGARGMKAMPQKVYDRVVKFKFSMNVGAPSARQSATGWTVPRFFYLWQSKLSSDDLKGMGLSDSEVKRYQGMYRMKDAASGKSAGYMTFRVMSQKSQGWVRPAVPGLHPLQSAVDQAFAEAMPNLEKAFEADLVATVARVFDGA